MLRYAADAVPWLRITVSAALVAALMAAVNVDPWVLWPLQGTAVGLVAGAVAWCFDEPAAAVVDPCPRGLPWRTLSRSTGAAIVLAVWCGSVYHFRDSLFGHSGTVMIQGISAGLIGAAYVTWRRTGGAANPGIGFATAVVPFTTAWALVRPLSQALPIFPYSPGLARFGDWGTSRAIWVIAALLALGVLAGALADARWLPARMRAAGLRRSAQDMDQGPVHTSP